MPTAARFGHGSRDDEGATFSASVRHVDGPRSYDVEVDSDAGWPVDLEEWRLVSDWLNGAVGSPADVVFPLELRADRWTADLPVDGVPHEFVIIGDQDRWSASARAGGRAVRVRGSGPGRCLSRS